MSKVRFVCLANSFKEGGRCLAGVILNDNNSSILKDSNIQWIRPVMDSTYFGEVKTELASTIKVLDILEIEVLEYPNLDDYQSENALFVENTIQIVGKYDKDKLDVFCDSRSLIFGNKGKAISEDDIIEHNHSLMFIKINHLEIYQKTYNDKPKPQTRGIFTYYGNEYDLPITDPVFLKRYQFKPNFLIENKQIYLTLSIGIEHNAWYYKLIACIILL